MFVFFLHVALDKLDAHAFLDMLTKFGSLTLSARWTEGSPAHATHIVGRLVLIEASYVPSAHLLGTSTDVNR